MNGGECELIFRTLIEFLMVMHEVLFIVFLVGEMEEESGLQRSLRTLLGFPLGIVVHTECVVAACLVDMVVFVFGLPEEFVIDIDGLPGWELGYLYYPMWK